MTTRTCSKLVAAPLLLIVLALSGCDDSPAAPGNDDPINDIVEDTPSGDIVEDAPTDLAADGGDDLVDASLLDSDDIDGDIWGDLVELDVGHDDLGPLDTCSTCHGDHQSSAPPLSLSGSSSTSETGVGAHREHLQLSTWRAEIACDECHLVPQDVSATGHTDSSLPAEVLFGELASARATSPEWSGVECSNVYCHGATLGPEGTALEPTWTTVDGSQSTCESCHGNPPGPPHPDSSQCSDCHRTMAIDGTFLHPERHIDGAVEAFWLPCDICHGSDGDPAPPIDIAGNTDTSFRGVGAHQSHLTASDWHLDVTCDECHVVPELMNSPGHRDSALPAEVAFGPLANTGAADGDWTGERCTNVYCHGATLRPDGSATEPVWTTVDGSQSTCSGCHGFPPGGSHTDNTACATCHPTLNSDMSFANADQHIDGIVQAIGSHPDGWANPAQHGAAFNADGPAECTSCHGELLDGGSVDVSCETCHSGWQTDCTFCHGGDDNNTGAPPFGVGGETSRTTLAVGAHTLHVEQTTMHAEWDCDECHTNPDSALSAGHIDGDERAELDFGALSPAGSYNATSGACTNLYCHGNGRSNGSGPQWDTNPTLACSSCHDDQTQIDDLNLSGEHKKHLEENGVSCVTCHASTVSGTNVIVGLDEHVDGEVQISFSGAIPMSFSGGSCTGMCHGDNHTNWNWFD